GVLAVADMHGAGAGAPADREVFVAADKQVAGSGEIDRAREAEVVVVLEADRRGPGAGAKSDAVGGHAVQGHAAARSAGEDRIGGADGKDRVDRIGGPAEGDIVGPKGINDVD